LLDQISPVDALEHSDEEHTLCHCYILQKILLGIYKNI